MTAYAITADAPSYMPTPDLAAALRDAKSGRDRTPLMVEWADRGFTAAVHIKHEVTIGGHDCGPAHFWDGELLTPIGKSWMSFDAARAFATSNGFGFETV